MILSNVLTTLIAILGISAKVHAAAAPNDGAVQHLQKRVDCPRIQGCDNCVKNNCAFSKTAFTCNAHGSGSEFVTKATATGCRLMNQMQGLFPAVKGKTKAGVIPEDISAQFEKVANHIFNGEPGDKTSGRHTTAAWLAANPGSKPSKQDQTTHITEFPDGRGVKTCWDSNFYSRTDIKNMCAVSIALGKKAKAGSSDKSIDAGFVVQSLYDRPACIHFFTKGTGSCFPAGTSAKVGKKLGQQCSGPGGAVL